ncbi:hypothetical protein LP316_11610 [Thalassotalea sp. LPB0316]|uniref:DUF4870 domain-containing protein n=1 Tax=Thalassotalea sp. LPB0316 TaxID=2769490 RepID=UPI0018672304|nr:hypothetical protein [Thalassotalea sp. LPB0316]QOL24948.1 hypothetical protein LP316_11610 [Thalassotalea sp. LPB0316]
MAHYSSSTDEIAADTARLLAVLSYFTIIGWLISLFCYGKNRCPLLRFHLRQSLGLILLFAVFSVVPLVGWLATVVLFVFWCIAVCHAYNQNKTPLPYVGDRFQRYFDFID